MTDQEYQEYLESPAGQRAYNRGVALGYADSILKLLQHREIEVSEAARERIMACTGREQGRPWFRRAYTAASVDEIFD